MREKRFDQPTRDKLKAAFRKAFIATFPVYPKLKLARDPADHEAEVFVRCLEGLPKGRHV